MYGKDDVFIVSACRTAIGSFCGAFKKTPAHVLGAAVIEECLKRADIKSDVLSEVIMGQSLTAGQGQNCARQASFKAGVPFGVPAHTVNMLCGSGLKSVYSGYQAIKSNEASIVLAGGQENMTMAQHSIFMRPGIKLGNGILRDTAIVDGLIDQSIQMHMGDTAEVLAQKYSVTRDEQDKFALLSQAKTAHALENEYFKNEIVPIHVFEGKKLIVVEKDEFPKPDTTITKLSGLKPVFNGDGDRTVTAGNASGLNDGAAAVLLCSGKECNERMCKPMAKIVGFSQTGIEPVEMGLGPVSAVNALMKKIGWNTEEVDLFELNEAFAVQSCLVITQLGLDADKVNVSGGAIALGHPIGCSGARILVTLLYNLKRLNKRKGVAALCIGGGMGIAIAIERLD